MPCSEDDDSQSGFASEPPHHQGLSKAELRKTNKPIMEKKRRARINHCLNELKDLLMDSMDKDRDPIPQASAPIIQSLHQMPMQAAQQIFEPARHSKLEKADILELTVKHLQTLQRQQLAAAIAADPAVLHRFKSGFGDCAVEVRRYLSRLASVPTGLRHRLGNHLNSCLSGMERLNPPEYPPLVPDPLRLDDERPSAFHFVRSTKPHSPPLSPMSCDSACDSSTELETPPRPVQTFPFPTPPSRSASDQDSSPETQKPTVSSTTISPEMLKQEALRNKKYMEPLSIVIDVENYKIGIDASPKRAVDYSMRHKLKRSVTELTGPAAKVMKIDQEKTILIPDRIQDHKTIDKPSAFKRVSERVPLDRKLTLPVTITTPTVAKPVIPVPVIRTVISHTAVSLAQSSVKEEKPVVPEKNVEKEEADSSKSPKQGGSGVSEMWRPW